MRLLLTATLLSFAVYANAQLPTKVLVIGIDGVRSDALLQANTPNIDSLTAEGTFTYTSWHVRTTLSGPGWSDIMTGVWEEKHEVLNNQYTDKNWDDYPYFVTRAKEHRPDIHAVQVTSWAPMSDSVYNDGWDAKLILPSDNDCVAAAVDSLSNSADLDVLFIHIDDVDYVGHSSGFDPINGNYMDAIETADGQVGQLMAALKSRPQFENEDWVVLLTTDHGGFLLGHGGITKQERQVWWIGWSNKGVIPQLELNNDLSDLSGTDYSAPDEADFDDAPFLVDIAVTALDHLLPGVDPDTVAAWDLDGRSWISIEDTTTGIEQLDALGASVSIYPNPVREHINVKAEDIIHSITVTDLLGNTVQQHSLNTNSASLSVADLPNGTYLLLVDQGYKGVKVAQFMVLH